MLILRFRALQLVLTAVTVAAALALPAGASAATGSLTYLAAGTTGPELDGARGLAVSPDGAFVYVAGQDGDALTTFRREANGTLTKLGCVQDTGSAAGCASTTDGLDSARFVAITPNGKFLYVTGGDSHTVVAFQRDLTTGALSAPSCVKATGATATCGASTDGLEGAEGVAVSPDGANLYVAAQGDSAVVKFDINATTGVLSNPGCWENTGGGLAGCADVPGLDAVREIAVSPNGAAVVVAAATSQRITSFSRSGGGGLSHASSIDTAYVGAMTSSIPVGVAVSPDSAHVYVGLAGHDGVRAYDLAAGGTLTNSASSCVEDMGAASPCTLAINGLAGTEGIAVSPDGENVYAAGATDNAVVTLARTKSSGAIAPVECDAKGAAGGCGSGGALGSAHGVAVSPDGAYVYVTAFSDDTVIVLARTKPPTTPGPTDPNPWTPNPFEPKQPIICGPSSSILPPCPAGFTPPQVCVSIWVGDCEGKFPKPGPVVTCVSLWQNCTGFGGTKPAATPPVVDLASTPGVISTVSTCPKKVAAKVRLGRQWVTADPTSCTTISDLSTIPKDVPPATYRKLAESSFTFVTQAERQRIVTQMEALFRIAKFTDTARGDVVRIALRTETERLFNAAATPGTAVAALPQTPSGYALQHCSPFSTFSDSQLCADLVVVWSGVTASMLSELRVAKKDLGVDVPFTGKARKPWRGKVILYHATLDMTAKTPAGAKAAKGRLVYKLTPAGRKLLAMLRMRGQKSIVIVARTSTSPLVGVKSKVVTKNVRARLVKPRRR